MFEALYFTKKALYIRNYKELKEIFMNSLRKIKCQRYLSLFNPDLHNPGIAFLHNPGIAFLCNPGVSL